MRVFANCALLAVCVIALVHSRLAPNSATSEAAPNSTPEQRDWPVYGGDPGNQHYSPLTQINRANVKHLEIAWTFDTGESGGFQTSPIIVEGVLYGLTPSQKVIALDAATGKLQWKFDSGIRGTQPDRGVAYWASGKDKRVLAGVMNFVYALDAETGAAIKSFGKNGRIDLREDLGRKPEAQSITLTSPGVIYKDVLIVGGREPETLPAPPGDIRAYDVRTGQLRWAFHTIPRPGEFGYEAWPKDAWQYTGAANNWAGMSLDVKRGLVFVPTGSAADDYYGANRVGDDLFANSLIVLKAETGERVWHFQFVRHDIWDRDLPAPPNLVTVRHSGRAIDAVAQVTKSGHVFLFDRVTGEPLFPIAYRTYPKSDVEGEVTADSQPLPLAPEPFTRQRLSEDMLTDRTPAAHRAALERFRAVRSGGQFVPVSLRGTIVFPGLDGGAEWGGAAFDPETSVLYVNANEMPWTVSLVERAPLLGE